MNCFLRCWLLVLFVYHQWMILEVLVVYVSSVAMYCSCFLFEAKHKVMKVISHDEDHGPWLTPLAQDSGC